MQNNINTNISWYEGQFYQKFGQKIKFFKIVCTKYMASSWGDDIINSLICIFIRTGQETFPENLRNFKMS